MRPSLIIALVLALASCGDDVSSNSGGAGGSGGSGGAGGSGGSGGTGGTGGSGGTGGTGGTAGTGGSGGGVGAASVTQYHGDQARTGSYVAANLTKTAAAGLTLDP